MPTLPDTDAVDNDVSDADTDADADDTEENDISENASNDKANDFCNMIMPFFLFLLNSIEPRDYRNSNVILS